MRFSQLFAAAIVAVSFVQLASGHTQQYSIVLDGPSESPANPSPGTGAGLVTVDLDLLTMRVEASFTGLLGTTTAAHIHCCTVNPGLLTAGVATVTPTFTGFPSGVTSGAYDHSYDMSLPGSYNSSYVTNNGGTANSAFNALVAGFDAGKAYLNLHTTNTGSGEIRGFLKLVPEPAAGTLLLAGLATALAAHRNRAS